MSALIAYRLQPWAFVDRLVFVLDQDIDDAVRNLNGHRPDFLGRLSSNRLPLIEQVPATTPSAGVFLRSASIAWRWCCRATTSGQYSLKEPGSTKRAMFSR